MTIKEFFSFKKNAMLWGNLLAMLAVLLIVVFGVLKWLDTYTRHGEAVVVPDVKGMSLSQAQKEFKARGLLCVVSDSMYVKSKPAGCILEYNPSAGQKIKQGRSIYLTINTRNVPLRAVPDVADNSSVRQAEVRLQASGFKIADIELVEGEKDWVYGVKYNDRILNMGEQVPIGASLTLMVGCGEEGLPKDSLELEELQLPDSENTDNTVKSSKKAAKEEEDSWF